MGIDVGIEPSARYTKVLERNLNRHDGSERFRVSSMPLARDIALPVDYVYLKKEGSQFQPQMVIIEIELCNVLTDEALP